MDHLPGGFGYLARLTAPTALPQVFPVSFPFSCGYSETPLEIEIGGVFVRREGAGALSSLSRDAFDALRPIRGFPGYISISWKVRADVQGDEIELRLSGGGARVTIPGDAAYQVKAHLPPSSVKLPVTFDDDTEQLPADADRPLAAQGLVICGFRSVPTYTRNEHRFSVTTNLAPNEGAASIIAATIPRHAHAVELCATLNNLGPPYPSPLPEPAIAAMWELEDLSLPLLTDPWRGPMLVPPSATRLLIQSTSESAETVTATFYLKS